ncbi:hypothetical protein PAMP_009952 [Pampus punctatissimus]
MPLTDPKIQPEWQKRPSFTEPPGSVPDSDEGRVNDITPRSAASSPRRYGELKTRPSNGLFYSEILHTIKSLMTDNYSSELH